VLGWSLFGLGWVPDLIFLALLMLFLGSVAVVVRLVYQQRRKALAYGYPSLPAYLRAAPRTDEERRDAADLALKGLVICLLGLLFSPLLLVGVVPLFYGVRKVVYASLGLGLADDADVEPPRA
jgi:hypothetical protein